MFTAVWKNTPAHRKAFLTLGGAAIVVVVILAVTRKPWSWRLPAAMQNWKVIDYVRVFSWWAGSLNAFLLAGLAATAKWWLRPSAGGLYRLDRPAAPRWFWPAVGAVMLLCATFGAMRLKQSFWDDEVYAMRRAVYGQWKENSKGELRFRPVKWTETFWFFDKPQHVLHSVLTRATLEAWRVVARPGGLQFREDVARLPSYIAGVLSVGAIALLLWRLGFPGAGVIAALLMVVHPWHIRYASEMRAYSLMLFLLPLCYYFLVEALSDGRWRWWVAFGVGLFCLMYSNALNIYPALGMGLFAVGAIALRWRDAGSVTQGLRLLVVSVFAGMAFLQLMLPCIPQFLDYLHTTAVPGQLDGRWLSSYFGLLFAGAPWNVTGDLASPYMDSCHGHPSIRQNFCCCSGRLACCWSSEPAN